MANVILQTQKLYWENPYEQNFEATVLQINGNQVWLDKTCFYPQSGGQVGDQGILKGEHVVSTKFNEQREIVHLMEKTPLFSVGDRIQGQIDWPKRYKVMRLHSASHVMEYFLLKAFPQLKLLGSNVNDERDSSTYSAEEKLPEASVVEVQQKINEFLRRNLPIVTEDDPKKEGYRWWTCGEIRMGCGGTHPRNTQEIGQVSLKCEKSGSGKIKITTKLV